MAEELDKPTSPLLYIKNDIITNPQIKQIHDDLAKFQLDRTKHTNLITNGSIITKVNSLLKKSEILVEISSQNDKIEYIVNDVLEPPI
jgi:hypothetical protein